MDTCWQAWTGAGAGRAVQPGSADLGAAKLKHAQFGASPECSPRLIDQLEVLPDDLKAIATAGEFTTETLEVIACQLKVGQTAPRQVWTGQVHLP